MFKSRSTLFELLYLDLPAIRATNGPGSTDKSTMAPSALLDNAALPALSAPGYTHKGPDGGGSTCMRQQRYLHSRIMSETQAMSEPAATVMIFSASAWNAVKSSSSPPAHGTRHADYDDPRSIVSREAAGQRVDYLFASPRRGAAEPSPAAARSSLGCLRPTPSSAEQTRPPR